MVVGAVPVQTAEFSGLNHIPVVQIDLLAASQHIDGGMPRRGAIGLGVAVEANGGRGPLMLAAFHHGGVEWGAGGAFHADRCVRRIIRMYPSLRDGDGLLHLAAIGVQDGLAAAVQGREGEGTAVVDIGMPGQVMGAGQPQHLAGTDVFRVAIDGERQGFAAGAGVGWRDAVDADVGRFAGAGSVQQALVGAAEIHGAVVLDPGRHAGWVFGRNGRFRHVDDADRGLVRFFLDFHALFIQRGKADAAAIIVAGIPAHLVEFTGLYRAVCGKVHPNAIAQHIQAGLCPGTAACFDAVDANLCRRRVAGLVVAAEGRGIHHHVGLVVRGPRPDGVGLVIWRFGQFVNGNGVCHRQPVGANDRNLVGIQRQHAEGAAIVETGVPAQLAGVFGSNGVAVVQYPVGLARYAGQHQRAVAAGVGWRQVHDHEIRGTVPVVIAQQHADGCGGVQRVIVFTGHVEAGGIAIFAAVAGVGGGHRRLVHGHGLRAGSGDGVAVAVQRLEGEAAAPVAGCVPAQPAKIGSADGLAHRNRRGRCATVTAGIQLQAVGRVAGGFLRIDGRDAHLRGRPAGCFAAEDFCTQHGRLVMAHHHHLARIGVVGDGWRFLNRDRPGERIALVIQIGKPVRVGHDERDAAAFVDRGVPDQFAEIGCGNDVPDGQGFQAAIVLTQQQAAGRLCPAARRTDVLNADHARRQRAVGAGKQLASQIMLLVVRHGDDAGCAGVVRRLR